MFNCPSFSSTTSHKRIHRKKRLCHSISFQMQSSCTFGAANKIRETSHRSRCWTAHQRSFPRSCPHRSLSLTKSLSNSDSENLDTWNDTGPTYWSSHRVIIILCLTFGMTSGFMIQVNLWQTLWKPRQKSEFMTMYSYPCDHSTVFEQLFRQVTWGTRWCQFLHKHPKRVAWGQVVGWLDWLGSRKFPHATLGN